MRNNRMVVIVLPTTQSPSV